MARGVRLPLSAGATLPRDLREWATWANNASAPHVRSDEATGYDQGEGVWFGRDTDGVIKMFIGDSAGNKVTWDGSTLSITGTLNLTNTTQTFTPSWTGFSVPPTGDLSYIYFGAFVVLFSKTALTGTSNSTAMEINNLPNAAKPPVYANGTGLVVNNGNAVFGGWRRNGLSTIEFSVFNTATGAFDTAGFAAAGTKGLGAGWLLMFPF